MSRMTAERLLQIGNQLEAIINELEAEVNKEKKANPQIRTEREKRVAFYLNKLNSK